MIIEQEILDGRRAYPQAQLLFAGSPAERHPGLVDIGWYGTSVHPETGAFALVRRGGPFDPSLIGEVIRVTHGARRTFVYVLGSAALPTDIALARRAFFSLGLLALESLACVVETIE